MPSLPFTCRYPFPAWLSLGVVLALAGCMTGCTTRRLSQAILTDDPVTVQNCLAQQRLGVNGSGYRDGWSRSPYLSPLWFAVDQGRVNSARALLAAGADVNVRIAMANAAITPLGVAAQRGPVAMVELLLAQGADVNAGQLSVPTSLSFRRGTRKAVMVRSPLHLALSAGQAECARVLIAAGADVNLRAPPSAYPLSPAAPPCDGPPIQAAAERRDVEMVRLLLERGAQVDAPVRTVALVPLIGYVRVEEPFSTWLISHYDAKQDSDSTAYFDILTLVLPHTRSRPAAAAVIFSTNVMVTVDGVACGAPPEAVDEIVPGTHTVAVKAVRLPRGLYVNVRLDAETIPAQTFTFEAGRYYLFRPVLERSGTRKLVPRGVELLCF